MSTFKCALSMTFTFSLGFSFKFYLSRGSIEISMSRSFIVSKVGLEGFFYKRNHSPPKLS